MDAARRLHCLALGHAAGGAYRLAGTWGRMRALEQAEGLAPEERERVVVAQLQRLLAHAFENVPYYREWSRREGIGAQDFRSAGDLARLPILRREMVQGRPDELRARRVPHGGVRANHTGGSTGQPLSFEQDANYRAWANGDKQRMYLRCGYRLGEPLAFLWGSDAESRAHKGLLSVVTDRWARNLVWVNTFGLHEHELPAVGERLGFHRPVLIVGYTRSLVMLARWVQGAGVALPAPRAVQSSAETLSEDDRAVIEDALGAPVFDRYGCREVGIIAHECEAHAGLHVSEAVNVVEIVGCDAVRPGVGRVVVTNLRNYAMPFIRYDTGDVAEVVAGECPCGRRTARLGRVLGRVSDLIVTPSGRLLHGEFFTHLFYGVTQVRRFQVVQHTREQLVVRIVPAPGAELGGVMQGLRRAILEHGDPSLRVEFEVVKQIPSPPSGKMRFTISEVASGL